MLYWIYVFVKWVYHGNFIFVHQNECKNFRIKYLTLLEGQNTSTIQGHGPILTGRAAARKYKLYACKYVIGNATVFLKYFDVCFDEIPMPQT